MQDATEIKIAGEPVRQISVFLDNRVGALRSLVRLLKDNHIEVLGVCLQEASEIALLRMILSDPDSASTLLMERGIAHTDARMVVVELREGDKDMQQCLHVLIEAEINIRSCYSLMTRPGMGCLLAFYLDDADTGSHALNNAGFKVLSQSELSR